MSFASAGVIGWPVAHSKSPLIHRFWLAKLGIDGDYGRFAVAPEHLGAAIRALPALGLCGVNVTAPHKVEVMRYLGGIMPEAKAVGAVNTVVVSPAGDTVGANTDVIGFRDPLRVRGFTASDAVVIGAGGAARAAVYALSELGIGNITLINRSQANALELANDFPAIRTIVEQRAGVKVPATPLLVNASMLGMTGQPALNLDLTGLADDTIVYDLVYAPLETPLLAAARVRGLAVIDGLAMLIGQAGVAFELFFEAPAPREHDAELRALLTA